MELRTHDSGGKPFPAGLHPPVSWGPLTAFMRGKAKVAKLAELRGLDNEQADIRPDSMAWLAENWSFDTKTNIPILNIDKTGKGWVFDGNHRILTAKEAGIEEMWVEVRYYEHSEDIMGDWHPHNILDW